MKTRRYQLRKEAVAIIERGHPWIFRDQLSSAAQVFADGDWLRLVDGANRVVGYGMFEAAGAIAIRVVRLGAEPPDAAWLRDQLQRFPDRVIRSAVRGMLPKNSLGRKQLKKLKVYTTATHPHEAQRPKTYEL